MTKRRILLFATITVLGSTAIFLGLAEALFRLLPVSSGIRVGPVTAESPVFHFMPDRDFQFSRDWDMHLVNWGRVNNAGFINDQNYVREDGTPLLAVVGDSYIEAAMVPYAETVHGRLALRLGGQLRVYSFGASGAALSQYLIWARYAVDHYHATAVVINVVGNDFDESLAAYGVKTGFWLYEADEQEVLRLRLFEYRPVPFTGLTARSALARYLLFNLQLGPVWTAVKSFLFGAPALAEPRYAGNTLAQASEVRLRDSSAAIDAFFRDLPELVRLPPERVAFTVDGFRYPESGVAGVGSYFDRMRHLFRTRAETLGYEVIDLDRYFFSRHKRSGERFEYPRDGHWSPIGHEVAFEAIMSSKLLAKISTSDGR